MEGTAPRCPEGHGRPGRSSWGGRRLTVVVDEEGGVGRENLVVADLAVLGGAVAIDGLHPQDAVIQLPLGHGRAVQPLHKHWGKLIHIIDPHVHGGPAGARAGGGRGKVSHN